MRRILALLLFFFCLPSALAAPRFPGEKISGNLEALRQAHEKYVATVLKAMALYAVDDYTASAVRKYTLDGSMAEKAVDLFDGGWYTDHGKVSFHNFRTENYEGDGQSEFSCDAYVDCRVEITRDEPMVYDMAYHMEFVCLDVNSKSETKWQLKRFLNILTAADRTDLEALNAMDPGLQVEHVSGPTFKGYLLTVDDPSRIYVGTCDRPFTDNGAGWRLDRFQTQYGGSAIINGGGFADPNGMGRGGKPNGIVVSCGEWIQNHSGSGRFSTLIGFDEEDRLIVRNDIERGTGEEKLLGLRDAVAFGPALILEGAEVDNSSTQTGLSARTAIGQRADGAVLMLVVDGRQPDSFGAAMGGLTTILLEHGAVVAANLDGGTSTALLLHGEKVNDGSAPSRVSRQMPTAFIVR